MTCLHLSVCTSQKLLIPTCAVDPAATVMYINTSSFLITHDQKQNLRLPRYIYRCPCVNTIPKPKYSSSLTHMPGAKQVNKTTMMIVHANVVAVFLTFGSSTLHLLWIYMKLLVMAKLVAILLTVFNFQSKWLYLKRKQKQNNVCIKMCTFFSVITQSQDHWHHHSSANRPALLFTWGNIITRFQCMNYILSNLHQMPLPILKTRHAQRYFGGTTPTKIKLALWQNHWGGQICPSGSVGDRPLQAAFQTDLKEKIQIWCNHVWEMIH